MPASNGWLMGIGIHVFFHQSTSARKRRCNIVRIKDETGVWLDEIESIKNKFILNFSHRLETKRCSSLPLPELSISPLITMEDNHELIHHVSEEEIYTAIFQMNPYKAPGLDGFGASFYQQHWSILKD